MKAALIDCYTDEPASFGVPPYISPKIRLIAGIFLSRGINVDYFTIDEVREDNLWESFNDYDYLLIYGGLTTPGHYIGGTPATMNEYKRIIDKNKKVTVIVSGPISLGYSLKGGREAIKAQLDGANFVFANEIEIAKLLGTNTAETFYENANEFYRMGASITMQHPNYPEVIVEFDISRGCERKNGHCSFCTEPLMYGSFVSRDEEGIISELYALKKAGVKAIRFGRSSNVLAYGFDFNNYQPNVESVRKIFSATSEILDPKVFHVDNANPLFIANHRKKAEQLLSIIKQYCTTGNSLSLGVESFDKRVRDINNLGGSIDDIKFAIRLINEVGAERVDGIPKLLPGINMIFGLPGTTEKTADIDIKNLLDLRYKNQLVRRVNIRQPMIFPKTPLYKMTVPKIKHKWYRYYKKRIRNEFDSVMVKRVFPCGSLLRRVIPEYKRGMITFGRQLGSYPILVGSPSKFSHPTDMIVVGNGKRSVTALPYGSSLNKLSQRELSYIPGIGKARAEKIVLKRPFFQWSEVSNVIGKEETRFLEEIGIKI
ncbi:MAG: radical SAM protein [Thermotogota bacterium]|nr:radical SAM protein [Thermotogota bacterium]